LAADPWFAMMRFGQLPLTIHHSRFVSPLAELFYGASTAGKQQAT
jgi:hypothetical protein